MDIRNKESKEEKMEQATQCGSLTENDIIIIVKELTNRFTRILTLEDAKGLGLHGGPGNGTGPRTKICKLFETTYIYGDNRCPKTYPIDLDLQELEEQIFTYKNNRKSANGNEKGVIGFFVHSLNTEKNINRPIRKNIKEYYKGFSCCVCGTGNTVCDHKNDLYNDVRVLNSNTQTIDDFQPLCNSCNLRKRSVAKKMKSENKRHPPPPFIRECYGIDFTQGDETFDPDDINATVGTYWHDPPAFLKECHKIAHKKLLDENEILKAQLKEKDKEMGRAKQYINQLRMKLGIEVLH
jgi:hypothetical protein